MGIVSNFTRRQREVGKNLLCNSCVSAHGGPYALKRFETTCFTIDILIIKKEMKMKDGKNRILYKLVTDRLFHYNTLM